MNELTLMDQLWAKRPSQAAKLKAFADEWLTGEVSGKRFNLINAARVAGYHPSEKNPYFIGSKCFRHPAVKEYINKRLEEYAMSSAEILMRFTEIARANVGECLELGPHGELKINNEILMEKQHVIKNFGLDSNGNFKVEFHNAHEALRDLAKARGLLKDSVEVGGVGGGPLTVQVQFVGINGQPEQHMPQANTELLPPAANIEDAEWDEL